MVLKQSWNTWTKLANCLFLISPTRTRTICLFTIYVSNVTFTHLETWNVSITLYGVSQTTQPASLGLKEPTLTRFSNEIRLYRPEKIQWNYYHPSNRVTRVFLEYKLKSLGTFKREWGHMVHYFKDIWVPIVLTRYCFNYFGSLYTEWAKHFNV